jgi:multidrug resistance efflux pump
MVTDVPPDEPPWVRQARYFQEYIEANQPAIDYMQQMADQLKPIFDQMDSVQNAIRQMTQDMALPSILARQHAALAAMTPIVRVPTEAELAAAQDQVAELVPEEDEEREQVAEQAEEIQADPEGAKIIQQLTGWVNEVMARLGDVAAEHKTGLGLLIMAWLVFCVIPPKDYAKAELLFAGAAVWLALRPPPGK